MSDSLATFSCNETEITFKQLAEGASVKIYVGNYEKLFTLPKALLCYHSKYFDCALNGQFKEVAEAVIILKEDDPKSVALIIQWMYKGELNIVDECLELHVESEARMPALQRTCRELCSLYIVANKLLINDVKEYAILAIDYAIWMAQTCPVQPHVVADVYHYSNDSPLTKNIIKIVACDMLSSSGRPVDYYRTILEDEDAIPGFAVSIMSRMRKGRCGQIW